MKKEIYVRAGRRIASLRAEKELTRAQLGTLTGFSIKFIYEVENGNRGFSGESLLKFANALDTSCDYILKGRKQ